MKKLELKMRNPIYSFEKTTKNDNYIQFMIDLHNFGIGFDYRLGDSRRYFNLDLLWLHLNIWF